MADKRPRIVIVGAGFGGLKAAQLLAGTQAEITIVDRENFHLFQPLLYQVATASLNPGDITWFVRAIRSKQDNVRFLKGTVTGIDHASTDHPSLIGGSRLSRQRSEP